MHYQFDSEVATQYGVGEAILINNLQFWIAKNKANERHLHDDRTWTYNSAAAFAVLFPFWSPKQIRRVLSSLEEQEVIMVGNYGEHWSDQTKWYAFKDEARWLKDFQKVNMHLPKRENDSLPNGKMTDAQTGKCTNGTDSKPDEHTEKDNKKESLADQVVKKWNSKPELPKVKCLTNGRERSLKARLQEPFFRDNYEAAIDKVCASSFCTGRNDRGWKADFDFFIQPDAIAKIMEGKYDDRTVRSRTPSLFDREQMKLQQYAQEIACNPLPD